MNMLSLLPTLIQEDAASTRRAAQAIKGATEKAEAERQGKIDPALLSRRVVAETRDALNYTLAEAAGVKQGWHSAQELLRIGMERDTARQLVRLVLDRVKSWLALADFALQLRNLANQLSTEVPLPEQWDERQHELRGIEEAVAGLLGFLDRPRPPMSQASPTTLTDEEASRYLDAKAVKELIRARRG
jgi:hypothetical protein